MTELARRLDLTDGAGRTQSIERQLDTAVSLSVENGRITRIYAIRSPHQLARLDEVTVLTRSSPTV